MNEELKKRIAAINSGTVPEGYKKVKDRIVPIDWEEKKGTDLFSYIRNGFVGTVSPYYVSKGHTYIQGNNIKDGKIIPDNMMYVNDDFQNSHQNSILHIGDIIVIQSGDVGKNAVVTDEYENANCHALIIMTPYAETNSVYISYLLNSTLGMDMIKGFVTGNVLHHILASDYKKLRYILPPLPEQQKIAEILSTQDKLIELQEQKIEQLKALKKTYLQKMFPKKGSRYPELRFKGFMDAWEQRELSELLTPSDERNSDGKYTQDDVLAASLGTELVKKHIFFGLRSTEESVKNYRVVKSGDIIYTKSPIKGFPNGIVRTSKGAEGIVPSLYCVYKCTSSINPCIIQSYLEDKTRLDAYLMPLVNIGARNNVNITDLGFLEGTVMIPQDIEEQTKIVNLLDNLTELITLHQRKLDQEKQKKKALMQLLLTGKVRVKP